MQVRCEICNAWLSLFQISKLCETCYQIRTIVKAYSADKILESLQLTFLVVPQEPTPKEPTPKEPTPKEPTPPNKPVLRSALKTIVKNLDK